MIAASSRQNTRIVDGTIGRSITIGVSPARTAIAYDRVLKRSPDRPLFRLFRRSLSPSDPPPLITSNYENYTPITARYVAVSIATVHISVYNNCIDQPAGRGGEDRRGEGGLISRRYPSRLAPRLALARARARHGLDWFCRIGFRESRTIARFNR